MISGSLLNYDIYSFSNALSWDSYYQAHLEKANDNTLAVEGRRFHKIMTYSQLIPIIRQIMALFEYAVAKIFYRLPDKVLSLEKDNKPQIVVQQVVEDNEIQTHVVEESDDTSDVLTNVVEVKKIDNSFRRNLMIGFVGLAAIACFVAYVNSNYDSSATHPPYNGTEGNKSSTYTKEDPEECPGIRVAEENVNSVMSVLKACWGELESCNEKYQSTYFKKFGTKLHGKLLRYGESIQSFESDLKKWQSETIPCLDKKYYLNSILDLLNRRRDVYECRIDKDTCLYNLSQL